MSYPPKKEAALRFVVVVQVKEVTSESGDRKVEEVFTASVRGTSVETAVRRAIGQLDTLLSDGDEQ